MLYYLQVYGFLITYSRQIWMTQTSDVIKTLGKLELSFLWNKTGSWSYTDFSFYCFGRKLSCLSWCLQKEPEMSLPDSKPNSGILKCRWKLPLPADLVYHTFRAGKLFLGQPGALIEQAVQRLFCHKLTCD